MKHVFPLLMSEKENYLIAAGDLSWSWHLVQEAHGSYTVMASNTPK